MRQDFLFVVILMQAAALRSLVISVFVLLGGCEGVYDRSLVSFLASFG